MWDRIRGKLVCIRVGGWFAKGWANCFGIRLGVLACISVGELVCIRVGKLFCIMVGELVCIGVGELVCIRVGDLVCIRGFIEVRPWGVRAARLADLVEI